MQIYHNENYSNYNTWFIVFDKMQQDNLLILLR